MVKTPSHPVITVLRYLWALPYTLVGLGFAPLVAATGGRVQVTRGVVEMYGRVPAFWLRHVVLVEGALAITIGHVVLARDRDALLQTRTHERVHVRQYERWGIAFGPAYLLASVWAMLRKQSAYLGNWFERDARAQAHVADALTKRAAKGRTARTVTSLPPVPSRAPAWRMRGKAGRRLRVSPPR
ncbi:MAG: signal peptide prediction [Coriobacteriia bacterium]|jgi:hypothetical protein|nr:signal peptide prediction [Coriobacteriia bacterium]